VSKRNLIVLIIFSLLLFAAIYFVASRGTAAGFGDPYKAIPTDASFIIETSDLPGLFNKLSGKSGLFREITSIRELGNFRTEFNFLDTVLSKRDVKRIFGFGSSVVSFHVVGKGRLVPLLSLTVTPELKHRHIRDILHSAGASEINETSYEGVEVFEIIRKSGAPDEVVYVSYKSGSMLVTASKVLLEAAIRHSYETSDIRSDNSFTRVFQAAGRDADRFFVVFRNMPKLMNAFTAGKGNRLASLSGSLAGSAEGDMLITDDGIIVSGYIDASDPAHSLFKYMNMPTVSFDSYKLLPSGTAMFETVAMEAVKRSTRAQVTGKQVVNLIATQILPFTGDEVTRALLDIRERTTEDNLLLIYEIRNSDHIEEAIASILKEANGGGDDHIIWFKPDDETKIAVYISPSAGLHEQLVPGFAPDFNDKYYAIYDNYLITGSSYVTISKVLYDNILNRTLANDIAYREFESTLPSRTVYHFYCVPSKITGLLADYLNAKGVKLLNNNIDALKKIPAVGFRFTPSNEMLYHSLSVGYHEEAREESTSEWETLLDTTACIKPFFFTNHNTGAKEIFVQDARNNVYLINATGRVLWKAPIKERINGPVYMIDYLRNGRFQLLFAGRENIHLLDRNGNYVERYPVKLRSPAAGPLSVFDYDNNRDYRLFIAGEDRLIYAYDKSGNVVKGYTPYRTQGVVRSEIKFFRVSGKDYIVAGDETGLYFLDRRGEVRFTVREPVRKAVNSELRLSSGPEPQIVCTSPDGEVQLVSFNGAVKRLSLQKFSSSHSFEYFDLDGDGTGEFIFIDKGKLYLYNYNGTRMFTKEFNTSDLGGPIGFVFSGNDRGIGVVDNRNNLIYIVDKDGELFGGFPLRGASLFSIGKLSGTPGFNLIVGGTDNFLYNYRLSR
jgi:hypothetical protein